MDAFSYVVDKGPLCRIACVKEADWQISYASFRLLGLPVARSVHAGVSGHYFLRLEDLGEAEKDKAVQVAQLPCVITFKDEGLPAKFGLFTESHANGKIYVACVETSVNGRSSSEGNRTGIVIDSDICMVKLEIQRLHTKHEATYKLEWYAILDSIQRVAEIRPLELLPIIETKVHERCAFTLLNWKICGKLGNVLRIV